MGIVLLLVWIGLAASLSLNAALLVRNAQLRHEKADCLSTIDDLKAALGGNMPGQESWRNEVL